MSHLLKYNVFSQQPARISQTGRCKFHVESDAPASLFQKNKFIVASPNWIVVALLFQLQISRSRRCKFQLESDAPASMFETNFSKQVPIGKWTASFFSLKISRNSLPGLVRRGTASSNWIAMRLHRFSKQISRSRFDPSMIPISDF